MLVGCTVCHIKVDQPRDSTSFLIQTLGRQHQKTNRCIRDNPL